MPKVHACWSSNHFVPTAQKTRPRFHSMYVDFSFTRNSKIMSESYSWTKEKTWRFESYISRFQKLTLSKCGREICVTLDNSEALACCLIIRFILKEFTAWIPAEKSTGARDEQSFHKQKEKSNFIATFPEVVLKVAAPQRNIDVVIALQSEFVYSVCDAGDFMNVKHRVVNNPETSRKC